ncbi:long-chain-fatty-acid--CoA ligase [Desulfobacula phenolica]|uniref:Long-chain acyl-CoA synthetase n=1 Tax=Desulfobacula phenolica TaxID=90732 RepID=A0A1H2DVD1_9BACT|nr:long-chain fatty acid--CoA ligase [Desulfobacula phenolica]SDT86792.1 long-chain acyl-CoA synthetase [Desulfobacula phenolica]
MIDPVWKTPFWPEGVAHMCTDYKFPLFKFLDDSAREHPDKPFTLFNGASRTFAQVKDTADRIGAFLAGKGIKKGDKIAIFLPNLPQFPEILFGILKAGAVAVSCNPIYTASELHLQLKDSQSKMVFCMDHPVFYPNTVKAVEGTDVDTVIVCNIKSYLPKFKAFLGGLLGKIPRAGKIAPGHLMFDDIIAYSKPIPPSISIDPEKDTAIMLYTGGTTGVPKGAELSHTNFTYDVMAILEYARFVHGDGKKPERLYQKGFHSFLGVLPWYHCFGITVALLLSVKLSAKLICIPDPRAGKPPFTEVLKAVQKYRPTFMPAVPTIFVAFTNHALINQYDLSSLMGCFSGGAPLPPEVCKQFEDKTGSIIFEGYGLTETAPVVSANPTFKQNRKIGSIGFPLPGTDIKILDIEDPSNLMPRGEDGEVAICGPQVMKGYWKNPEANAESFVHIDGNRYFLTGDIGHIDSNGYVAITDRKKDMIIVSGFNVYPRDVEDILYNHPKVELAAVVGIPDEKSGEKVKAFIKLKQDETATQEEINAFCKQHMAGYKRPKIIEFRDELPISNVGKVLRRILRDEELKNVG